MARPQKKGLDYFPVDVRFDRKIELLVSKMGGDAIAVMIVTWQLIYSEEGYYAIYDDDFIHSIRLKTMYDPERIREILECAFQSNIFDSGKKDTFGIITSKALQKRYFSATDRRKTVNVNKNYLYDGIIVDKNPLSSDDTDSKKYTKKSKVNKSKESTNVVPKYESEENKNINPSLRSGLASKPDFIDELIGIFSTEFFDSRQAEFLNVSAGKERQAMGKILGLYRKKHPDDDSETAKQNLRNFFRECLLISETWHYDRMSPSHILNQMNQISRIIERRKNGRPEGKQTGASNADILSAIVGNFADSNTAG